MTRLTEVSTTDHYLESLQALEGSEVKRVEAAVLQLFRDPDHPSLNLHPLKGRYPRDFYTIRASQELRVLLAMEEGTFIVLHAGHHDAVYELAERRAFVVGRQINHIGMFDLGSPDPHYQPSNEWGLSNTADDDVSSVVGHWTNAELSEVGFSERQVAALRHITDLNDALSHIPDLDDDQLDTFLRVVEQTPEEFHRPITAAPVNRLHDALATFGGWGHLSKLMSAEEAIELASRPIEAWMVFLHPEQRDLVERNFSGPARVRGSAGTGKTVVALHRALHLAARNRDIQDAKPILFTTYIKSLPPVFENLYLQLPGAKPGEVEFNNIDSVARAVCIAHGEQVTIDLNQVGAAFSKSWDAIVTDGSPISAAQLTRGYITDEINLVIKGRGISSLDHYLEVERTGRRVPLHGDVRKQVWALHQRWDDEMRSRGTRNFPDVILRARELARSAAIPRYSHIIIDESQDLTLVGLQLVRALVNGPDGDKENGLFFVGDGAQRIYPGGYTLRQAGIEVRGRTSVLKVNYRNTKDIIDAAMAVAGDQAVDDLGDQYLRGDADAETDRPGTRPSITECESFAHEVTEIAARIEHLTSDEAISTGDIGVFAPTKRLVDEVIQGLASKGFQAQNLERYEGLSNDAIKVGTYFRAKGLEFKAVFLPGLSSNNYPFQPLSGTSPAEAQETKDLTIGQLFVAMTRARDQLMLLFSGTPADVVADHLDAFEIVKPTVDVGAV